MARQAAWIGLGSNQGDSRCTMASAVRALGLLPESTLISVSSLYRTPPWGDTGQPDFLNAVAQLDTGLAPSDLLHALHDIERELGRRRDPRRRWGPRVIDLDLLLHGATTIDKGGLVLPHPRMHERAFVLVPLMELNAGLEVPGRGPVADCLAACEPDGIQRIEESGWHRRAVHDDGCFSAN